jgi:uncharacterized protein (DUF488 family)
VIRLHTIGFTKKTAQRFFGLLQDAGVQRLVDIRLHPDSQLAGFAKRDDLAYFLSRLIDCEYHHFSILTPTPQALSEYRQNHDWSAYVTRFEAAMDERGVPACLDRAFFEAKPCCLLCSEDSPDQCHRRLIAERLAREWVEVDVTHLR